MKRFLLPVLLAVLAPAAFAQDLPGRAGSAVTPGQPVPELRVAEWVKGAPLTRFEPGKVHVVEFWAVWCAPCIANIPHLNALQRKYGKDGLVIIGMTSPDLVAGYTGPRKEGNSLPMVREFVERRGAGMDYRVAYDTPDRAMHQALMGGRSGIPHAFLFGRDGRLVVDFHPTFLDDAIAQVLAGTWDAANGAARMTAGYQRYVYALNARRYETFRENYDLVAREFPGAAKRLYLLRFSHTLRAGDLPAVRESGELLMAQARELGDAKELGQAVRNAARELAVARNSGVGGLLAGDPVRELGRLLEGMAAVAAEVGAGREPAALAAQAELAHLAGDLAAAVGWQEKAVAATLGSSKSAGGEQRRLEELQAALKSETRRRELMRATGRPD